MLDKAKGKGSVLLRAMAILEGVVEADRPVSPTELVTQLGLPKPTVHRLCKMLQEESLLQRAVGSRRLVAGPRLAKLALNVLGSAGLRGERHAILESVSAEIGETCNMAVPDGARMLYVDRVETHWPLRLQFPIGSRVPLYCTASGKLYLGSLPRSQRRRLLSGLVFEAHTSNTITDRDSLELALDRIRDEEIGTDDEEFLDGMVAVAVPVKDGRGRLCATIATQAPVQRLSLRAARAHVPVLRRAAAAMSRSLGEQLAGAGAPDR